MIRLSAVLLFAAISNVLALSAISGSPCYDTCNGSESTTSADIVCVDEDWTNTTKGETLSSCLTCLQSSDFTSGFMTDSILFLYYISSVQQTCLSGKPGPPISSCSNSCSGLPASFSALGGRQFFTDPWTYCSNSDNAYENDAVSCSQCLQGQEGTVILGNFVHIGNVGCASQPDVRNGEPVYEANDVFNTDVVGATSSSSASASSTSTRTASSISASATTTETSASSSTATTDAVTSPSSTATAAASTDGESGSNGLSRGAAAGIGIAIGIIGIAAIIVLALLARRRMQQRESGSTQGVGSWKKMRESPIAQMEERGATPPAAGVFMFPPPPAAVAATSAAKRSKSFRSVASKSIKSLKNLTPRSSEWYYAANPKHSDDLSALPQKGWD